MNVAETSGSPNGGHLLPMCLDTLRKQTFRNFEVIVVDNGSRECRVTPEYIESILDRDFV